MMRPQPRQQSTNAILFPLALSLLFVYLLPEINAAKSQKHHHQQPSQQPQEADGSKSSYHISIIAHHKKITPFVLYINATSQKRKVAGSSVRGQDQAHSHRRSFFQLHGKGCYNTIMDKVPSEFQFLFPSSDIKNLDVQRDKAYIVQTLLKNSTMDGWKWMVNTYSSEDIAKVLKTSKLLKPKETYFWSYFLNVPQSEIACLNKDSQKTPKTSWAY